MNADLPWLLDGPCVVLQPHFCFGVRLDQPTLAWWALAAEPLAEGVLHRRLDRAARRGQQVVHEHQLAGGVLGAEGHRGVAGDLAAMPLDLAAAAEGQPQQPQAVAGTSAELVAGVHGGLHRLEQNYVASLFKNASKTKELAQAFG
jgi:hypothetical protein